jgi:hypothetical protein
VNHAHLEHDITIHSLNLDWELVRKQKIVLLDFLDSESPEDFADCWNNSSGQDLVSGVVNLIDALQDQAAEQLGEEIIFEAYKEA